MIIICQDYIRKPNIFHMIILAKFFKCGLHEAFAVCKYGISWEQIHFVYLNQKMYIFLNYILTSSLANTVNLIGFDN